MGETRGPESASTSIMSSTDETGRDRMSEQDERKVTDASVPSARHVQLGLADLLAFLGVLVLAGSLAFLLNRTGQLSARLAFAGAAGLVVSCVNAWRRLRRAELRRWRSGQFTYRGRRMAVTSAWGVEGQPPPAIKTPAVETTSTPAVETTSGCRCCTSGRPRAWWPRSR
jgi:hypothetical protein